MPRSELTGRPTKLRLAGPLWGGMVKAEMKRIVVVILLSTLCVAASMGAASASDPVVNPWAIMVSPDTPDLGTVRYRDRTLPVLGKVERIWDESKSGLPYNAFTDLIRFRDEWYCVFREATRHNNDDSGRIRVLKSPNGKAWKSAALLEWDGGDLRDPKLSVTPEGRLMLNSSVAFITRKPYVRQSITWLSRDGQTWSSAFADASGIDTWRWSVTWYQGVGYSMDQNPGGTLYTTRDGRSWLPLAEKIYPNGVGSETSIAFGTDGKAYCLLRAGGPDPAPGSYRMGQLGVAAPPYRDWQWTDLGRAQIGGPKLVRLADGRFLGAGRMQAKTILFWIDPEKRTMQEFLALPSGGQGGTSYAGIVEHEGLIWISYYSGHEYPTEASRTYDTSPVSIYLARVKLAPKGTPVR